MQQAETAGIWRQTTFAWITLVVGAFLVGFVFYDGIGYMLKYWEKPEYNYGYLIPAISLFFIWQRWDTLQRLRFEGSWLGVGVMLFGLALLAAGTLGAVFTIVHYAMVLVVIGLALAYMGIAGARQIWVALLLLLFMIPLPGFVYESLSNELQLVSSRIGVGLIRLFGISVFLEGNVIDLGSMKLQVVEACSGLRYLFPLMTLGFIAGCFYKAPFWKRAFVFLSTIPVTVLMNSLRIGVIGILVEYGGRGMAEGFLHDFEGWVIFMLCTLVLIAEMWLLANIGKDRRSLSEVFAIELPSLPPKDAIVQHRPLPVPFLTAVTLLAAVAIFSAVAPARESVVPPRTDFTRFPLNIGEWRGRPDRMEQTYIDALNFDDYLLANYAADREQSPVNLYIGYYATQHADKVPHSPRACIPAGGWAMRDLEHRTLVPEATGGVPLQVNRAVIERGRHRQLVYYWFKQRDRNVTNEFHVKWLIFWDALTRQRSDGALVRLITPLADGEDIEQAEHRLASFARQLVPELGRYVPD